MNIHQHPWRNGRDSQTAAVRGALYLLGAYFGPNLLRRAGSNPGATQLLGVTGALTYTVSTAQRRAAD